MVVLRAAFVAAMCFSWAPAALAQTPVPATREDLIARQQEEKARNAAPYEPGRAEALFLRFEERGFPLVGSPPGFYPALDSVYPGGGVALGAGYRKFTGHRALIDVRGLYSIATYKRVEATFRSPGHVRDRVGIGARAGWLDAPRVAFFGIGARTDRIDRTVFRIRQTYLEGDVDWRPAPWVQFGVTGGYEAYDQGPGTGRGPSIEERFTPGEAPGLGEDWRFAKVSTSAALLWTDTPAYSRNGGFLRWTYDARVRLKADGSFGLTRTEIVQHIPILRETWVVSLRGRADAVVGEADAPYFLMPSLGSGGTLRAFPTGRFRDRHSLLLSGEWRWIPSRLALDLALFVDAGSVGATWKDVTSGPTKSDYGIGVRFHTPSATVLRLDLARGAEGMRLVFSSSAAF